MSKPTPALKGQFHCKVVGLSFAEAVDAMRGGLVCRRSKWMQGKYMTIHDDTFLYHFPLHKHAEIVPTFSHDEILAVDWQSGSMSKDDSPCLVCETHVCCDPRSSKCSKMIAFANRTASVDCDKCYHSRRQQPDYCGKCIHNEDFGDHYSLIKGDD